jgi:hypothetical protein
MFAAWSGLGNGRFLGAEALLAGWPPIGNDGFTPERVI